MLGDDLIEIAHVDAAKSLELWSGICRTLRHRIIASKTILIFQDFDRVKLPFQVYGIGELMEYGKIIGGSFFGTVYFKIEREIPQSVWDSMEKDSSPFDQKLANTSKVWREASVTMPDVFTKSYDAEELLEASIAYVNLYAGRQAEAKDIYNSLSTSFRSAPENAGFQKDFL